MSKLQELHANGQSVWLDFIRRDMLESGELEQLIASGIRGLTSNPTIFQKAIAGSAAYDQQIRAILDRDPEASAVTVFEQLAISDIRRAADLLRDVFDRSNGSDGFVSLEVSPHLAHDTEGTITDARRLWSLVDRPNLMIKVPATDAGIPAIEALIAEGINVNVTLLFSLDYYLQVADAYVRGIDKTAQPSRVASVASFFVSRVDTKTDGFLDKVGTDAALALRGTIAVANAKLAYEHYQRIFEGSGFSAAAGRGAARQRVLWASTSTKNPEYSDLLYVETLVGPNTVNTMPPETIDAFLDHGDIDVDALTTGVDDERRRFDSLAAAGVSMDEITDELQSEGVAAFADSFDDVLVTLAEKMTSLS